MHHVLYYMDGRRKMYHKYWKKIDILCWYRAVTRFFCCTIRIRNASIHAIKANIHPFGRHLLRPEKKTLTNSNSNKEK